MIFRIHHLKRLALRLNMQNGGGLVWAKNVVEACACGIIQVMSIFGVPAPYLLHITPFYIKLIQKAFKFFKLCHLLNTHYIAQHLSYCKYPVKL